MLDLPDGLQTRLSAGVTTLCWCWRVTRRDGAVFGFTDHDRDVEFDGVVHEAAAGFGALDAEQSTSLSPGHAHLLGGLDSTRIREADVEAGLWSQARVETWRVDWQDPDLRVRVRQGEIGEIRLEDGVIQAELRGLSHRLDNVVGRVFSRRCDAELGDARCGIAPEHAEFGSGCDKRIATCRERFANTVNFRGFAHMVGNDVLQAGPAGEARHDGGSRGLA